MKNFVFREFKFTEGRLVVFSLVGMVLVLVISLMLIGNGVVRHVVITYKEVIKATVAFKNIAGDIKVVGIIGNTGINPTLVSRTGETQYSLTVINEDKEPHMLYIDGINVHTKLLRFGENDTITIRPDKEGTYNYYDRVFLEKNNGSIVPIGEFKTLRVAGD
ncbi:MAG TPA: cupredoxin domain-containing protein [Nitrososphaeraceae archaeon]|nr:cupredoxin domain-containing protein [Nitrososphaeraceae archaeon]